MRKRFRFLKLRFPAMGQLTPRVCASSMQSRRCSPPPSITLAIPVLLISHSIHYPITLAISPEQISYSPYYPTTLLIPVLQFFYSTYDLITLVIYVLQKPHVLLMMKNFPRRENPSLELTAYPVTLAYSERQVMINSQAAV